MFGAIGSWASWSTARLVSADAVLVAAGPWTPALIDPERRWVPIQDRWGVVVEVELADGPTHVLEEAEIGAAIGTSAMSTRAAAGTEPANGPLRTALTERRSRTSSISASCPLAEWRRSARRSSPADRIP